MNTARVFHELRDRLRGKDVRKPITVGPKPRHRRLSDLVDDKSIRAVYEDRNDGTYQEALRLVLDVKVGGRYWRKILRAIDHAFQYGDYPPPPRVQFLHRNLLG